MLPVLLHSLHLQKYKIFWNKNALQPKICKKETKNLEVDEIMLIFAARMRVAYRRDNIKLRNRSFLYNAAGRAPAALVFLVSGRAWIEHLDSRHDFLAILYTGVDNNSLTIKYDIARSNHSADKVGLSARDVF